MPICRCWVWRLAAASRRGAGKPFRDELFVLNDCFIVIVQSLEGKILPEASFTKALSRENLREGERLRFIRHSANYRLAKRVVYTQGKTPEGICEEVVGLVG